MGLVALDIALALYPPTSLLSAGLATTGTFVAGGAVALSEKYVGDDKVWPNYQGS